MALPDRYSRVPYDEGEEPESLNIFITIDPAKVRGIANQILKNRVFSTKQSEAFLTLHGSDLKTKLEESLRDFIQKKVG